MAGAWMLDGFHPAPTASAGWEWQSRSGWLVEPQAEVVDVAVLDSAPRIVPLVGLTFGRTF